MKKILLVLLSMVVFVCQADTLSDKDKAVKDLQNFCAEVVANNSTYTDEQWKAQKVAYDSITSKLEVYDFTNEELKEIGKLKGRFLSYYAKAKGNSMTVSGKKKLSEFKGMVEGFFGDKSASDSTAVAK